MKKIIVSTIITITTLLLIDFILAFVCAIAVTTGRFLYLSVIILVPVIMYLLWHIKHGYGFPRLIRRVSFNHKLGSRILSFLIGVNLILLLARIWTFVDTDYTTGIIARCILYSILFLGLYLTMIIVILKTKEVETRVCPECGVPWDIELKVCSQCKYGMKELEDKLDAEKEQSNMEEHKICPECNSKWSWIEIKTQTCRACKYGCATESEKAEPEKKKDDSSSGLAWLISVPVMLIVGASLTVLLIKQGMPDIRARSIGMGVWFIGAGILKNRIQRWIGKSKS
ncbi:hypothetical protein ES705_24545 [subsurface metagenome]